MNIVILGQQGSGKGTQAALLAEKFDLEHIDMGKTLREIALSDTPLGREIYEIQNVRKTLVSSKILREILNVKLKSIPLKKGIVFDGAPRTLDQVKYLEDAMLELGRKIDYVLFISIPEQESIERASRRRLCNNCQAILVMGKIIKKENDRCPKCGGEVSQRKDDTPEGIKKRLEVFKNETMPVLEYYEKEGSLIKIDGMQPVKKVFADIIKGIKRQRLS
ncbi:MAG: adenylate kinase [Candidatus Moranbacteria bacterium CG_4_9_14_3_um_filter_42_9]|nr:MAG: adenylate kinase [Candidatus Moranbacteria bacterium CG_4_9_14_3_um_filter_42_9]